MKQSSAFPVSRSLRSGGLALAGTLALLTINSIAAHSQVMTIDTSKGTPMGPTVDRRYAQIEPTKVTLPREVLDARGHQDLLRVLTAEQGFAMRPLPRGKKGLSLVANGKLSPSGEGYVSQIAEQGLSVKPGDRVVLSNVRIEKDHIVFDINGGPDRKHELLRHVQVGVGGPMTAPVVADDGQQPTGSRITLHFDKYIPEVTPAQVKTLLAPLISFDVKTPVQAYTDTLPPKLKEAILSHHVMVGMSTEMVLYALGQPEKKSREIEGQMPFEEWIYGHPPQDVSFVRVNGNRVIRIEVAKLGQPLEVFTKNEVDGLMTTDGHPVLAEAAPHERTVPLGDTHRDLDKQAPAAPPTLRKDGEKLPSDTPGTDPTGNREGPMKPVVFPKDTSDAPARTVQAHPAPKAPPEEDSTEKNAGNDTDKDAGKDVKQDAPKPDSNPSVHSAKPASPPAQPQTPPASNFYPDHPQPGAF